MQLSIVIPSHLRADLLRRCLAAVAAYRPTDSEVLVVDDASLDGCVSAAAADFPFVRVIRLPKQSGFCVAANSGIRAATGDVVIMGTPAGVGQARTPPVWMRDGDTIEIEIERIGTLSNPIRKEG